MIRSNKVTTTFTFPHRVRKCPHVAASDPDFWIHDNGTVETNHVDRLPVWAIGWAADDVVPPSTLEVAFELNAQWAVVPEAIYPAIDFGGLEDEPAPLAQRDDGVH